MPGIKFKQAVFGLKSKCDDIIEAIADKPHFIFQPFTCNRYINTVKLEE